MSVHVENNLLIVKTKLYIPPLKLGTVPCERLIERLEKGSRRKLTLISAPAGFGKTTVVCQWINRSRDPVAWYALDESDNEPTVFYRYLITAIKTLDPSFSSLFDPLDQGRQVIGKDVMVRIINHLSDLPGKYHLILDDFHLINSESICSDISYLLQNSPPQLHLTIITRQEPSFPVSKMRATEQMTELKSVDLKFSREESVSFFRETMKLDLSDEKILEMHELTEGWIVGLQIIGLAMQKSGNPEMLAAEGAAGNKHLLDYLFEEVFRAQPEEVQDFLLKTSILNQFNTELGCYLTQKRYENNMLRLLEKNNLFILPLDVNLQWYRYHSLFSRMLRNRLAASGENTVSDLHKRASEWYADNGYLEQAFQHAYKSADIDYTADLLEIGMITLIENYEWAVARRWIEKIPEQVKARRFMIQLFHVLIIFLQEEMDNLDQAIADLEQSIEPLTVDYLPERRKLAEDFLTALRINILYYKESGGGIPEAEDALRTISSGNGLALGLVRTVLSTAYIRSGDLRRAMDVVHSGLVSFSHLDLLENPYIRVQLLNRQVQLEYLSGRLINAERLLGEAFEFARREDLYLRSAMAMFNITFSWIYYQQNRLDEALKAAERCIEYSDAASDLGYLLPGLHMKAFILALQGFCEEADEVMSRAIDTAAVTRSSVRTASTELAFVKLSLLEGRLMQVSEWIKKRKLSPDEPFSDDYELECILTARYLMAENRFRKAESLLRALRPRSEKRGRITATIEIDIIRSACLFAQGSKTEALEIMTDVIRSAGPEGFVRPFSDTSELITDMLFSLKKNRDGIVRIYAGNLLKQCDTVQGGDCVIRSDLGRRSEPLSERETEILKLVVVGMTNKEISETAFISMNTVKTHIRNIYAKLEVSTREDAILAARGLQ